MMDQPWQSMILTVFTWSSLSLCLGQFNSDVPINHGEKFLLENYLQNGKSNFERIGRGLSSFIRIGKNEPKPHDYDSNYVTSQLDNELASRQSALIKQLKCFPDKRLSSISIFGQKLEPCKEDINPFKKGESVNFLSSIILKNKMGWTPNLSPVSNDRRSGRRGQSAFIRIGKRGTRNHFELHKILGDNDDYGNDDKRRYIRLGRSENGMLTPPDNRKRPLSPRFSDHDIAFEQLCKNW